MEQLVEFIAAELSLKTGVYFEVKNRCIYVPWASKAWHQSLYTNMYLPFIYKGVKVIL